jgi:membrane-associated HD superfamily phosphohydrolase
MPRVKLVWTNLLEAYSGDSAFSSDSREIVKDIAPEFEEISDEDFQFLRQNLYKLFLKPKYPELRPKLVVLDEEPIQNWKDYIKTEIEKAKQKKLADEKLKAAKKLEKAKQSKAKKLKQLEQLKKELGVK